MAPAPAAALMDARTRRVYERGARRWVAARTPAAVKDGRLAAFARRVGGGGLVADLGCGPGWYAAALRAAGLRTCALDLSAAMLREAGRRAPGVARVCADLAALPFGRGRLDAAWASNTYCHVPLAELPLALAELHAAVRVGGAVELTLPRLEAFAPAEGDEVERRSRRGDDLPGRLFVGVTPARARALLAGAGFEAIRATLDPRGFWLCLRARRARTLPDLVRPGLRLLVCGLNPSLYSADCGVPFARPGNRFWAAALAAGLVAKQRDPLAAVRGGLGFTDLVKRSTAGADELEAREYARGLRRVEDLVRRHRPAAVCFVGLDGWRRARARYAQPGWVEGGFGGQPAYLMPSTSGRNARTSVASLAAHLRAASRP